MVNGSFESMCYLSDYSVLDTQMLLYTYIIGMTYDGHIYGGYT